MLQWQCGCSASKVLIAVQDRVETSPEQMAQCTAMAERLTTSTGVRTRVIGWYHSHPHITVLPSHVDVHTQVGKPFVTNTQDGVCQCHHIAPFGQCPAGHTCCLFVQQPS